MCSNGLVENDEDRADTATTFEVEAERNVVPFNRHIPMLAVMAQLPWLWEYKRKKRKIPKKEREKEKKEGLSDLLVYFLFVKISENHHKIYWLLYHFL